MGEVEDNNMQLLSYQVKFFLAVTGMVFFPLLHQLIDLLIRRRCSWIEKGAVFRISTRVVSGVQALVVITIAVRSIYLCKNIMTDEDPYIHAYIWFAVSYFPYDIVVMYIGYAYKQSWEAHYAMQPKSFLQFFKREPILVLHHIIFLAAGLPITEIYKNRLGDFFLACFLLAEGSTPFYNMRGVLKEAGIKDGYFFTINGILFVVTFLLFRVLSVPFMFVRYSYYADIQVSQVPFAIPYKCTITCLLFFLLQFYWFTLICRGLRAMYLKKVEKAA